MIKNFFSDKWNSVLLVLGVLLITELVLFVAIPPTPCYASMDTIKGQNFDQPIFTTHSCKDGQVPININDFYGRR